jgi:hypothetical protein
MSATLSLGTQSDQWRRAPRFGWSRTSLSDERFLVVFYKKEQRFFLQKEAKTPFFFSANDRGRRAWCRGSAGRRRMDAART